MESLLAKWLDWLGIIQRDVQLLLSDRYIFRETMEIVEANPNTHDPNDFVNWFVYQYIRSAAVRVRQLTDKDRQCVSLRNLLDDMERNATSMTRAWYVGQYPEEFRCDGSADRFFDEWSGPGGSHVDPATVRTDRDQLVDVCKAVKHYVDKSVAHRDRMPDSHLNVPTWGELDRAIDTLDGTTCKCIRLLRREAFVRGLLPTWQYDWQKVFETAWKPSARRGAPGG